MQAKSFCLVLDLQPQYAAYLAITAAARHVVPTTGDNVLTVDVGGGLQAEEAINEILGGEQIASSDVACERVGSALEFLSGSVEALNDIVATFATDDAAEPEIADSLLLENVSFDYANIVNRSRKGALVVAGDSLLTLECSPAEQVGALANQIETRFPKAALVNIDARAGRVIFKGTTSLLKSVQMG